MKQSGEIPVDPEL